jgi:5S rRNA maturation endonuclease (ribonuclease M5)
VISEADLLGRFERVKRAGADKWTARCPAHDDRTPSLSIRRTDDRWLLKCHADCETADVLDAARLTYGDLFADSVRPPVIVAEYVYTDERGRPLYVVERYHPKDFRQRTPDGGRSLKGVRRVPYRLPAVRAAVEAGERVWIAEGEKDVHALVRAGAVATCHAGGAGGAGQWKDSAFAMVLYGADVTVVADCDDAGRKCAQEIADALDGIAASLTIVEPARGKDAHDHLRAGLGLGQFVPVGSREYEWLIGRPMDPCAVPAEPLAPLPGFPFMHPGMAAIVVGPSGRGRSSLAGACAYDAALVGLRVAYLGGEVTGDEFDARAAVLVERRGADPEEVRDLLANVRYLDLRDTLVNAWGDPAGWIKQVAARYEVVIVDPLGDALLALPLDDRNRDYRKFYTRLVEPLAAAGVAVVMLDNVGHSEDARERPIEQSAKVHKADLTFACSVQADPVGLRIKCTKTRSERCAFRVGDVWLFDEATRKLSDPITGKLAEPVKPTAPVREGVERAILANLPAKTKTAVAEAVGRPRNDQTFNDAWKVLERAGRIAWEGDQWVVVPVLPPLGEGDHYDNDGQPSGTLFEDPRRNAIWGPE